MILPQELSHGIDDLFNFVSILTKYHVYAEMHWVNWDIFWIFVSIKFWINSSGNKKKLFQMLNEEAHAHKNKRKCIIV